jgi:hypothetical protein
MKTQIILVLKLIYLDNTLKGSPLKQRTLGGGDSKELYLPN